MPAGEHIGARPLYHRRTDPAKFETVLQAKVAGQAKREIAKTLGMPWSTVNDIWKKADQS